ncbi:type I secretion system permease/ATPase [Roseobacter litoralis]|uniref:type I secretion system permease/ATPase n=1 Tax=Roseobacter litoralis TaxID=42443 RepID=UPI0024912226|nr:type I secretion system permease/ATPase [Roseobacter litoralis]
MTQSAPTPYRTVWSQMRSGLLIVLGFSAVINILMLTGSIYMMQVYDRVLSSGSVPTLVGLFTIVVILFAFLGLYDFLRARMLARTAVRFDQALASTVYQAWVRSGVPGAAVQTADAKPMRDLETLRGFIGGSTMQGIFDLPFVPLFVAILFMIHPWIGLLTVAGAVIVLLLASLNKLVTNGRLRQAAGLESQASAFAQDTRSEAESIISMGMVEALTQNWTKLHKTALCASQSHSDPSEVLTAFSKSFRMLLQSAILTMGAFLVLQGQISAGMIIAASILSGRALAPVDQAIGQFRGISQALAAHRSMDVFFTRLPVAAETTELPVPKGKVDIRDVTKLSPVVQGPQNATDRKKLLQQVSFGLEPGDGLGVVGHSACGKSTLARLLVGAWNPDLGNVRLNGATFDQWDPAALGQYIGYMPQSLKLLPGTIRDNIARFNPEATDAAVIKAAKMAGVHSMILQLADGYQTPVGGLPDAAVLSGGQVQRIGLARAVFGKPALVVLDEPNANLDEAGDSALNQAIRDLRGINSTVVVMAHRPSVLTAVNKILVLEGGRVAHFGAKETVMTALKKNSSGQSVKKPTHQPRPAVASASKARAPSESRMMGPPAPPTDPPGVLVPRQSGTRP